MHQKGRIFKRVVCALAALMAVTEGVSDARVDKQDSKVKSAPRLLEERPLYDGLPEGLPADYLQQRGFLPFDRDPDHGDAPITSFLSINGERTRGGIFTEKLWVRIPEGSRIDSRMSSGVDVWSYPLGTESIHEIRFDTEASEPFELRMVRLLTEDRWAFGAYRFRDGAWTLNKSLSAEVESAQIRLRSEASVSKIEFKRINIRSCQSCHHMNAVKEQFHTRERTGPCAFVSWNSTLLEGWAREFEKHIGYFPIVRK